MLTGEQNRLICCVDKGMPAGRLFRTIWLPALLASQLPASSSPPVRLKILGEELVAFRDGDGAVGIVQAQCAHRLAPLFYGQVEARGIRCAYHGWLYDRSGQCVEIPSDSTGKVCRQMKLKAYAVSEKAGIVWIYMGEGIAPALPRFPWIDLPAGQLRTSVWLHETNWLQGLEGEIDTSHIPVLHKCPQLSADARKVHRKYSFVDYRPQLSTRDTAVGFMSISRRNADAKYYWRVTQWMAPMFSFVPSAEWPQSGRAWVPIDDDNTYCWDFTYNPEGDIPQDFQDTAAQGIVFPPETQYRSYQLNTGAYIETWIPRRTMHNNYLIDRSRQGASDMTGIHGVNDQDRAMQEGMGRLSDRSQEKLIAADLAIVTARRKLLELVSSDAAIESFRRLVSNGAAYAMTPLDTLAGTGDLDEFLAEHAIV